VTDRRGTNSPETEGAAPWMPNGGSPVHKSSSEDNWTPGEGSKCHFWYHHHHPVIQYSVYSVIDITKQNPFIMSDILSNFVFFFLFVDILKYSLEFYQCIL
jgi:hypothetical protein